MIHIVLAAALVASNVVPGWAAETHNFNVPAEAAPDAIRDFASQAYVQILAAGENVKDKQLHAVNGTYSTDQGLHILLADSGLAPQYVGDRSIALVTASQAAASPTSDQQQEGKKSSSGGFRVVQVDQGASSAAAQVNQNQEPLRQKAIQLEEVVVTAQKRGEENLQKVPVPAAVLSASNLLESNQLKIQDYYSLLPGFTVSPGGDGALDLSVRGISSPGLGTNVNPTVGVVVDDVPYGGSWLYGQAGFVPDIDPGDLSRVELLRGPQGTLYGANSMGGLLKFVTVDPSTTAFSGRVEAGTSDVYNGAEPGYNFRGSVNIPLGDTLAMRASVFTRQDPGYIDNPVLGIRGINEDHVGGGRLAAMWWPSDTVSLKVSAQYQHTKQDGESAVAVPTPGFPRTLDLRGLQQNWAPGSGASDRTVQVYSAILTAKLGSIDVTSTSGYNVNKVDTSTDLTDFFAQYTQKLFGTPDSLILADAKTKKFSQELRFSSSIGQRIDWILGAFYTYEDASYLDPAYAVAPVTGANEGYYFDDSSPGTYWEYAAFGDLTLHFTDRFDVQVGARESQYREIFDDTTSGILNGNETTLNSEHAKGDAFTYLLTPEFKFSPDLMVYARLASGFRPGGPNSQIQALLYGHEIPATYNPDKTYNYEVGLKGDFLDHRLSVDASLYYIDWKDIQITVANSGTSYFTNGSQAKSQGLELTVAAKPIEGLTVAGWITWGESVLTANLPSNSTDYGVTGDRLPNTTRFTGNLSINEEFPITSDLSGFIGGVVGYVGDRLNIFTATAQRQDLPGYTKIDLRAGVKYGRWAANLYADNAADRRGLLATAANFSLPYSYYYIQPRMIGLNVSRSF